MARLVQHRLSGDCRDGRVGDHAGQGTLLCGSCAGEAEKTPNLNAAALSALRHIALADDARLFNFELGPESLALLARATEQYLLFHLDYPPKTLAFLKTVL